MKNIWLMGGLGNVLFQVLAFNIAKKKGESLQYIDILTKRNIVTKLLGWTIHERLYDELISVHDIKKISVTRTIFVLMILFVSKVLKFKNNFSAYYDENNKFELPYSKNIFGYFQNKDFLEENKEEVLELGQTIRALYKKKERNIIVHYRLGDSDWARKHNKYYEDVKKLLKNENEKVLIATDSPKEALDFFSDCKNIELTEAKSAMDDFIYMINAKKLYCAPSTFSWWAAHINSDCLDVIVPRFLNDKLGIYKNATII